MSTRRVTITIDEDDYEAFVAAAAANDRTVAQEIRHRLRVSLRPAPAAPRLPRWPNEIGDRLPPPYVSPYSWDQQIHTTATNTEPAA